MFISVNKIVIYLDLTVDCVHYRKLQINIVTTCKKVLNIIECLSSIS